MQYRTNNMIVTAQGTTLSAAWDVERSPNGAEWTVIGSPSFSAEASTPVEKLIEMVDKGSLDIALRDRVVQELAAAAASYYNGREIVLP